ncbi:MAG: prepilin-type N-terminal cleavage/methylation domain-containing protein [Bacilli bacterium]
MNKKGFTLVELLATITIIGIICIIIFPSVNNLIKNNEKTTAEQIGNMIISATKKYVNDERLEGTGCLSVPAKKLIDFGYIETIDTGKLTCDINNSFVRIDFSSNKKEYSYHLSCNSKTFDTSDKTVSYCDDFVPYSKTVVPRQNNQYAPDLGSRADGADEYGLNSKGDSVLPKDSNLIPIRYHENNWVVADVKNRSYMYPNYYWYDYNHLMWANMAIVNDGAKGKYNSEEKIGTIVEMEDILSIWVWIPRFKFTLNNNVPTVSFSKIEKDDSGNVIESSKHTSIDKAFDKCKDGEFCIPNSFFDEESGKELSGFWVSKYLVDNKDDLSAKGNTPANYFLDDYNQALFDKIKNYENATISDKINLDVSSYDKLVSLDYFTYSKYGNYNKSSSDKISTDNIYGVYNLDSLTMTNYCFGLICKDNNYVTDITKKDQTIELTQNKQVQFNSKYLYPYNKSSGSDYTNIDTYSKNFKYQMDAFKDTKTFKFLFAVNETEGTCDGKCCYVGYNNPNNIIGYSPSYTSLNLDKRYYSGIIQFKTKNYFILMEKDYIDRYDYSLNEDYISCQYRFTGGFYSWRSDHPDFQDCWYTLNNLGTDEQYKEYLEDMCKAKNKNYSTSNPAYLRLSLYFK